VAVRIKIAPKSKAVSIRIAMKSTTVANKIAIQSADVAKIAIRHTNNIKLSHTATRKK
jgi:hypothetical protein